MGAWGYNSFENDTALDWVLDLEPAADPFKYPMSAIDSLLASDLYLDGPECEEAIAAAECLAAANGHSPPAQPEQLEAWLKSIDGASPEYEMLQRATEAIHKVRDDEQSELRHLWQENDEFEGWLATIDDLLSRLSKSPA